MFLARFFYKVLLVCLLTLPFLHSKAISQPSAAMQRTSNAPRIDGVFSPEEWENATIIKDFRQFEPVSNAEPSFSTSVYLKYDDEAIYVAARLFDPSPDSIDCQLGQRDNSGLNADYFTIAFDTYNNQQDAYYFMVSASGIQTDLRMMDMTYDAVWKSVTKINEEGWFVEMYIPYSALRFPSEPIQTWGLQVYRDIRRYREAQQWALEEKGVGNPLIYWGKLSGFSNIKPPLRLSFTPYVSSSLQHNSDPAFADDPWSTAYNGGMDLKVGINESFTLDMILLPDFSQVQSDKIQKNLTAFELIYDENRTFFNEGTDLFQKGDLFYSRRIGRTPLLYYSVSDSLQEDEQLTNNPVTSRLLNAVKVSGRTSGGLGIGLFNAITGNTWTVATDSLGNERKILSDPATNYNILVIDQALPNNSSVYFINTNTTRPVGWDDSNVTGGGATIGDKSKTYQFNASLAISHWNKAEEPVKMTYGEQKTGYKYAFSLLKNRGKFQFSLYQSALDKNYNINDMGINRTRDQLNRGLYLSYRIYEPFSIFRNFSQSIGLDRLQSLDSKKNINTEISYNGNTTFNNYMTIWWGADLSPFDRHDFYEPRRAGRYFLQPGYWAVSFGFSSDYRKRFALDGEIDFARDFKHMQWGWAELEPIFRVNNRLSLKLESGYGFNPEDLGYIGQNIENIWFGERNITTFENAFAGSYMISRQISLDLWVRHFWQQGEYTSFFQLQDDGTLKPDEEISVDANYNYNFFSIDFSLGWEFAPGSMLSFVWKNTIQSENDMYKLNFFDNFDQMIGAPQLNMLSIKALYHLDYLQLKRNK